MYILFTLPQEIVRYCNINDQLPVWVQSIKEFLVPEKTPESFRKVNKANKTIPNNPCGATLNTTPNDHGPWARFHPNTGKLYITVGKNPVMPFTCTAAYLPTFPFNMTDKNKGQYGAHKIFVNGKRLPICCKSV